MTEHPPHLIMDLLQANRLYLEGRPPIPRTSVPSKHVAIVTCMDVRIDPLALFGLHLGDAHVLRNAGARVTDDVIRSLAISQQALQTDTILLMPHTHCGVLGLDSKTIRPRPDADQVSPLDLHAMETIETSLREDLGILRKSAWIHASAQVFGLILDITTGGVHLFQP